MRWVTHGDSIPFQVGCAYRIYELALDAVDEGNRGARRVRQQHQLRAQTLQVEITVVRGDLGAPARVAPSKDAREDDGDYKPH